MKYKELIALIEKGEDTHCEFKLKFSSPEKIAKEMMAFANTTGGYILFGVDDDGRICGVASEKAETELINEAANNYCVPPVDFQVEYRQIDGEELVIVYVPQSNQKPHRLQDYLNSFDIRTAKVYIRVNDKSIQAGKEFVKMLLYNQTNAGLKNYSIGDLERAIFNLLNDEEFITAEKVAQKLNISGRRASRALINLVRTGLLIIHTKDNGEHYFSLVL